MSRPSRRGEPARPGRACRGRPRGPPRPARTSRAGAGGSSPGWPGCRAPGRRRRRASGRRRWSSARIRLRSGWAIARSTVGSWSGRARRRILPEFRTFYCATINCARYVAHMPGHRSLARNHDFTVLWIGQTASILGSRISMFVFPLLTYALTGSAVLAAAAEALHLLGLAAMLLPAGVLADRYDRRRLMRTASGPACCSTPRSRWPLVAGAGTVPHLFVVALLTGVATGVFLPAETAAVRAVVAPDDLPDRARPEPGPRARRRAGRRPDRRRAVRRHPVAAVRRRRRQLRRLLRAARPDPHRPRRRPRRRAGARAQRARRGRPVRARPPVLPHA